MNELLPVLKAVADPTRLTIVMVLEHRELNVGELTRVLAQSQPRVSRHLRLLCEAGVLTRRREGANVYFSIERAGAGARVVDTIAELVDSADAQLTQARERLAILQRERRREATQYFESMASEWDAFRDIYVGEAEVEEQLLALTGDLQVREFLDLGTGTGRILELFAPRFRHGIGIDLSPRMLRVARTNLDRAELAHCQLRRGDLNALPLPAGCADVAVLHHVLHFLDDPAHVIGEAARMLRPRGRLVIADFAPHDYEELRVSYQHRRLGFADREVTEWCEQAGLLDVQLAHVRTGQGASPPGAASRHPLEVTIWMATQRADAPSHHRFEVA